MSRRFFAVLSFISAILAALSFVVVYKQLIDIPEKYEILAIGAIPFFALFSVICFFIQSVIHAKNEKQFRVKNPDVGSVVRQGMIEEASNTIDYSLYQLHTLSYQIAGIIVRIIVTALIVTFFTHGNLAMSVLMYITVSYCWIFIKATGNYIIGIFVFFIFIFVAVDKITEKFGDKQELIITGLLVGVLVIDAINIIRFITLRIKVTKAGIKIRRLTKEELKAFKANKNVL